MNSCRALFFVAPLVLLIVIAGCGGGGFDPIKSRSPFHQRLLRLLQPAK
jgi:hypothetical protein